MAQIIQKSKLNTNRIKITNKENEDNLVKDVEALIGEVNALSDGTIETTNLELSGELKVDAINRYTGNFGVSVEGVLFQEGAITGGLLSVKTESLEEGVSEEGITVVGKLKPDSTKGIRYTGTIVNAGTTTVALNTMVGMASFTTIPDIAAGATQNIVITNTLVTDDTVGMIVMQTNTAANGSAPRIKTIVYSLNTITITLVNSAAATATGGFACDVSFQLYQLV